MLGWARLLARPKGDSIPSKQSDHLALNAYAVRRQYAHFVGRISRLERDGSPAPAEAFQGGFLIIDQRDDDIARFGGVAALEQRNIAIENTGFDHRIPAHFEGEMLAGGQQLRRHIDGVATRLN